MFRWMCGNDERAGGDGGDSIHRRDDSQPVFPAGKDSGNKPVAVSFFKICLMIVIAINSSEIAPYVTHVDIKFAGIAGMVFLLP